MESSPTPGEGRRKVIRRASSLQSIATRRKSVAPERPQVDLKQLVRVYLLDGSSKVLQVKESSTVKDVLAQLQYNMDLSSIKCHALFRICQHKVKRLPLENKIKDAMSLHDGEEGDVKILMRAWIHDEEGLFDKEAMQDGHFPKEANSALYLKYMEAVCMVMMGKCYLTEDEAVMLGCLKMQVDSGDYCSTVHTVERVQQRVANSFPSPVKEKMQNLLDAYAPGQPEQLATRIQLLYSRLSGYNKAEAQIEFLRTLRIWCPFYSAAFFTVDVQYDNTPDDPHSQPPVKRMSVGVSKQAIFLITLTNPPVILRQPYNRIVKWVSHKDMNIFCYWILKAEYTPQKVEELERQKHEEKENNEEIIAGGEDDTMEKINPGEYCDCVYLVSEYTEDIELVFSSYLALIRDRIPPILPGDDHDDEESISDESRDHHLKDGPKSKIRKESSSVEKSGEPSSKPPSVSAPNSKTTQERKNKAPEKARSSIFNKLFMSAKNVNDEGDGGSDEEYNIGGIVDNDFKDMDQWVDKEGINSQTNVAFEEELFPPLLSMSNIDILNGGSGEAQIAATIEELNQLTFKDFLDDDEEDDDGEDEDSDNSSASGERRELGKPIPVARRKSLFKWS